MLQRIHRGHVDAMRGTFVRGRFSDDLPAEQRRLDRTLTEALHSHNAPRVLFAMDRLRQLDPDRVRDALPQPMVHTSPQVRAAALRAFWTLTQQPQVPGADFDDLSFRHYLVHGSPSSSDKPTKNRSTPTTP